MVRWWTIIIEGNKRQCYLSCMIVWCIFWMAFIQLLNFEYKQWKVNNICIQASGLFNEHRKPGPTFLVLVYHCYRRIKKNHRPNAEFIEISMNLSILLIPLTFETGQLKQRKTRITVVGCGRIVNGISTIFVKCKIFCSKIKSFS